MQPDVNKFMQEIAGVSDIGEMTRLCNAFILGIPPSHGLEVAAAIGHAHPFFLPEVGSANAKKLRLDLTQFSEWVMRAKLSCRYSTQLNMLIAGAPDPLATRLALALGRAIGLPQANLTASTLTAAASAAQGMNQVEQETDELAVIRSGLNGLGYVARHALVGTPYLCRQMQLYNIRPLVAFRSLAEAIVLLDAEVVSARRASGGGDGFFHDGLPVGYQTLDRATRLSMLVDLRLGWMVRFFVSWKRCEALDLVAPVWVDLGRDVEGREIELATRIAGDIGHEAIVADLVVDALLDTAANAEARTTSAGTDMDMPAGIRDRINALSSHYGDGIDLTPIL